MPVPLQRIVRLVAPHLLWATTPGLQECRHQRQFAARLASKPGAARIPQPKPLFLSEADGLWIIFVSGYHRTPLRKRVFGTGKGEPPLLQCHGEAPCAASGKMSRVGIFSALEKTKALLAKARNLENLYPRKRNCFLPLRVAPA